MHAHFTLRRIGFALYGCLLSALGACAATSAQPAIQDAQTATRSTLNVILAARSLEESDWAPVEDQGVLGVEVSQAIADTRLAWDIGFSFSYDDADVILPGPLSADVSAGLLEAYGGGRFYFTRQDASFRPYIGAALALINAEFEASGGGGSTSDDDTSLGLQLRVGGDARISDGLRLGLEWRSLVGTDLDLFGVDVDADYGQLGVVLGISI